MKFHRSTSLALGLLVLGGFTADIASASSDSFVEVQMSTAKLREIARAMLIDATQICPFEIPCIGGAGTCVVDHFDIGSAGVFYRDDLFSSVAVNDFFSIPMEKVFFAQDATVHVKTLACALSPSCGGTTAHPITINFEVSVNTLSEICLTTESVTGAPAGVGLPAVTHCFKLDIDRVSALTGLTDPTISGAAVSMDDSGSRIAARFELNRTTADYDAVRTNAWTSFGFGDIDPSGGGEDWSILIHQSLIIGALKTRLEAEMAKVSDQIELNAPVAVGWSGAGLSGATLLAGIDATVVDGCDIDVTAGLSVSLGINGASNGVAMNGVMDWDADNDDVFWCGMLFGGPIGASVLAAIISSLDLDMPGLPDGCAPTGDLTMACDQRTHPMLFSFGFGATGNATLDAVFGSPAGLTLRGPLALTLPGLHTAQAQLVTPEFGVRGDCTASSCEYVGGLYLTGTAEICSVEFSNDPLGIFEIERPAELLMPAAFTVTIDPNISAADHTAYQANPYRLYATVATTRGMRTYAFGEVDLLDQSDEQLACVIAEAKMYAKYCLRAEVPFYDFLPERWGPDDYYDPRNDIYAEVLDYRDRVIDYSLIENVAIDVRRNTFGTVTAVTIRGTARARLGSDTFRTQDLALPVSVPTNTRVSDNETLIAQLAPSGYLNTVSASSSFLPPSISSARLRVSIPIAQLRAAARR